MPELIFKIMQRIMERCRDIIAEEIESMDAFYRQRA